MWGGVGVRDNEGLERFAGQSTFATALSLADRPGCTGRVHRAGYACPEQVPPVICGRISPSGFVYGSATP